MQRQPYVTLNQVIRRETGLANTHVSSFKMLLSKGLRAQYKKEAVARINFMTLCTLQPHKLYDRVLFYGDGRCEYIASHDYRTEINYIRTTMLPNMVS